MKIILKIVKHKYKKLKFFYKIYKFAYQLTKENKLHPINIMTLPI